MSDATAQTTNTSESAEKNKKGGKQSASATTFKGGLLSMNVYEGMLLISLILVIVASLLLFWELNTFGNILTGAWPWRTVDFEIPPITQ